jgi:mono/diheme cytochrome c family protein
MKRNKHLLLWSSLGGLLLLAAAAYQEHFRQDWRKLQDEYRALLPPSEAARFTPQLRQIFIPELRVTDRCVSCHLGMSPNEAEIPGHRVFGAHPRVSHDPAEFGCTVCHGGQGRATATADAHGEVEFWPEPMIPRTMSSAGCGSCHTHVTVPGRAALERGRALFERNDCLDCHSLDGRGGTVRPFHLPVAKGPDLSTAGASGYREAWYEEHVRMGEEGAEGWRTLDPIPAEDRGAIEGFLSSRVGAPELVEAKSLFHSLGCRGCHALNGVGGDDGPDLSGVGNRDPGQLDFTRVPGEASLFNWFAEHLRAPAKVVPGSQMPYLGLPEEDVSTMAGYMLALRAAPVPEAYWPPDKIRARFLGEREFAVDGVTLYGAFCAACHGADGKGIRYPGMNPFPSVANPDFLDLVSDGFLAETIRRGRPGTRMPGWGDRQGGLREGEIETLVAHLRELGGGVRPSGPPSVFRAAGDPELGRRLYASTCASCHGPEGRGGEGPALSGRVLLETADDRFLTETIRRGRRGTTMPGFGSPSLAYRILSDEEIEAVVTHIRNWETSQ